MPSRGLKWRMGVSVDYTIHILQYSIHYTSTYIKPLYLSLHNKRIRQNAFPMCLLRKTQHCRIRVCRGVKQSRVPSCRWESRSIWHQMLTNIWVHNIGTCITSSYPSLHHRKSDWNRISCENFGEISISEPFRSQPGSQMADRSQAFEMSIDAASATYLVWYHLCGHVRTIGKDYCWHMTCSWSSEICQCRKSVSLVTHSL